MKRRPACPSVIDVFVGPEELLKTEKALPLTSFALVVDLLRLKHKH